VKLDADEFALLAGQTDGTPLMRAIVLHELGHVVGLAHVDDPRELMYGDNVGLLDFGAGDRAGLARVGSGSCS
jgi:predicted Zn-dependent protease